MSPLTPHKCKSGEEMQIYLKRSALKLAMSDLDFDLMEGVKVKHGKQ